MPIGQRMLIRALLQISFSTGSPIVRRRDLLNYLVSKDPNGEGWESKMQERVRRTLRRYLKDSEYIEKVGRGEYRIRMPQELRKLAAPYDDLIHSVLDRYEPFFSDAQIAAQGPPSAEAQGAYELLLGTITDILSSEPQRRISPPSASRETHPRFAMPSKRATRDLARELGKFQKRIRRAKKGRGETLPAKAWQDLLQVLVKSLEKAMKPTLDLEDDEKRKQWGGMVKFIDDESRELSVLLGTVPIERVFSTMAPAIDDFVNMMDQAYYEGPYAAKTHRDPRLRISTLSVLKAEILALLHRAP